MITKFKIYEATDRGEEIIYTLKTQAISTSVSNTYKYNVNILETEDIGHGKYTLSIETTPGCWYVSTLMENDRRYSKSFSIQGDDWLCENWRDIMKELIEILPKLDILTQTKKYNL